MAVGIISSYDDVNSLLLAGRADLCVLGRAHLYDPNWTLHAAAEQGYAGPAAVWPRPWQAGARQPQTGRVEGPKPRLELVRQGRPAPRTGAGRLADRQPACVSSSDVSWRCDCQPRLPTIRAADRVAIRQRPSQRGGRRSLNAAWNSAWSRLVISSACVIASSSVAAAQRHVQLAGEQRLGLGQRQGGPVGQFAGQVGDGRLELVVGHQPG